MLDHCSDTCGWIAGIIAALAFGSFPVPIKLISKVKVDPMVMQTYKSTVCFLTCWLVIPMGVPFRFTSLGIISGLFWVPGATAGIYGIRNAGLAISVGTWSSLIVISSFCWGIFVFGESVKSVWGACFGALVLIFGLIGMSTYSAPINDKTKKVKDEYVMAIDTHHGNVKLTSNMASLKVNKSTDDHDESEYRELLSLTSKDSCDSLDDEDGVITVGIGATNACSSAELEMVAVEASICTTSNHNHNHHPNTNNENGGGSSTTSKRPGRIITRRKKSDSVRMEPKHRTESNQPSAIEKEEFSFMSGKIRLTRRQMGIIGAIINGAWGSNNMIPMHYASKKGFSGAGYLISYSVGSMIITILMWIIRFMYHLHYANGDCTQAYHALPKMHLREMGLHGFMSGCLYSLGNFCSIIAVTALGQGVGYSFVQTSMLVSGIWGIFYFGEVQGFERITKWIASSLITILGILMLSYEHKGVAH